MFSDIDLRSAIYANSHDALPCSRNIGCLIARHASSMRWSAHWSWRLKAASEGGASWMSGFLLASVLLRLLASMPHLSLANSTMGNIVWLASYPKSGNTWLRAFLANFVANRSTPVPLNELSRYAEDEANPDLFSALGGQPSSGLDIAEIAVLRPQVHSAIAERAAGTRFVKTHNMAGSFNGYPLHNMQVTAGAVYVVRNPLDVAISMTHHFGIDLDEAIERLGNEDVATANDAQFVSQILGSWSLHVKSWTEIKHERILVVRYEDMIDKPVKVFLKIARLVTTGVDRTRVDRAIRHADFRNLSGMERQHGFIEASDKGVRFFRRGRANEWRDVLSREQVQRVVDKHREQMQRFDYVPTGF